MKIFSSQQIRSIDQNTIETEGITSLELVERAAASVACEIISRWRPTKRVCVFAGSGNNGADALAVARMLIEQGYRVEAFLFNVGEHHLSDECRACRDKLLELPDADFTEINSNFQPPHLSPTDLVIDGLFGNGLREPLTGGFQALVRYINESGATIVSIDVPSGLFADWNKEAGVINRNVVHASLTLTFQFPRLSFLIADNAELVGEWKVLDIELNPHEIRSTPAQFYLIQKADVRHILRHRHEFSSKADYGSALLVAGRYGMLGAAVLAARGALRAGVGRLTVHAPRCGHSVLQTAVPEAMCQYDENDILLSGIRLNHDYNAIGIGPGLGHYEGTINAIDSFLKEGYPQLSGKPSLVLDADALNCIAERGLMWHNMPPLTVITPHAGEFDRLFGEHTSAEMRLKKAIEMSDRYKIIILLKGRYTAIVRPDGKVYFNSSGNPAMATPGSGDVLTGVILALMAQGYNPQVAATLGAFIHGYAGDLAAEKYGEYGVTASDIAERVGIAIRDIMQ